MLSSPNPEIKTERFNQISIALYLLAALPFIGLLLLKWPSAMATIHGAMASGSLHSKSDLISSAGLSPWMRPLAQTISYLYTVRWALLYGLLISSVIRTFFNPEILKNRLAGGAAGVPLMLCSCCVAPVATGAFQRTRKLGPALALLIAAPSLNPAAIVLTFLLFPPSVGVARLLMALVMVFAITGLIAMIQPSSSSAVLSEKEPKRFTSLTQMGISFAQSFLKTSLQTIPFITLGVLIAMALNAIVPIEKLGSFSPAISILVISALAVPMAFPTFFEIPLALALFAAHMPTGAVAALLFAGPAINLPSLFTLAKAAGIRVAVALAGAVFAVACIGGIILSSF